MASSSSSSQNIPTHLFLNSYNTTSAPPPTPSTQSNTTTTTAAADTLTRLLHRLPPTLSFPTRLSPRFTTPTTTKTQPLPTISLSSPNTVTTPSFELGYFQLSPLDHLISSQLAKSAELEALSLLDLSNEQRHAFFPKDWPLGYDDDDDDDGDHTASFCLDSRLCTTTDSSVKLTSLGELTNELEKVGLHVVEKLACTMGFENPFRENGPIRSSSLMWVSLSEAEKTGKVYPFVVGLQYQIRAQKWSLGLDSDSINVEPEVGSILVAFGDIAQVWSNGKLKKVRGRPTAVLEDGAKSSSRVISMTMLLTLPLESTVSPLLLPPATNMTEMENVKPHKDCNNEGDHDDHQNVEAINNDQDDIEDLRVFNSFSFEDYAWRVYNDRLHLKDPLDRYRKLRN